MIGFDIEHISKVKDDVRLLEKIATEREKEYVLRFKNKKEKVASLWVVKEAVFKCLDVKCEKVAFKDIELMHEENGKPYVVLHGNALALANGRKVEISLSHTKDIVGAVAILR